MDGEVEPWPVSSTITIINHEGQKPSRVLIYDGDGVVISDVWIPKADANAVMSWCAIVRRQHGR